MQHSFPHPAEQEYASYYGRYISLHQTGDILSILEEQVKETLALLRGLSEEQGEYSYVPGKWSIKEVIGHIIDTERIFAYRALCFARGDQTPLPGMEQDDYVEGGRFNQRSCESLAGELEHLRAANLLLFRSWDGEIQSRMGTASDCRFTARSIPFLLAGHELHHLRVLRERYLPTLPA